MSLIKTAGIIAGTATATIALGTIILSLAAPKQPESFTLAPLAKSTPIATPAPTPATIAPVAPKPISTPAPKVVIKEVVKVVYVPATAPAPATIAPVAPKPPAPPAPSNVCDRQCEADFMAEGIAEANKAAEERADMKALAGVSGTVISSEGFVNLRVKPMGRVMRQMPVGTAVTILRAMKDDGKLWLVVEVEGDRGWMIATGFKPQ